MAKLTFRHYLSVFTDRRMLIIFLLGFSSGMPLALTGATLQAWLTDAKLDVGTIGLFALVGIPYTCKFVWAPFLDRYALPFLGLRRGWAVVSQVGLTLSVLALAFVDPVARIDLFSVAAFFVAFFSATQDVVVDAYRTEILTEETYGVGAGISIAGYRIAMVISGGVALVMADQTGWPPVYVTMAALCLIGAITMLFAPEPGINRSAKSASLRTTLVNPFVEFFQRSGAMEILLFVMIYKLSTLMATSLTTKFLLDLGYTKTLIGSTNKVVGMIATILGTVAGGSLMMKFGMKRSLWIFGVIQSLVGITFWALPHVATLSEGLREAGLVAVIGLDYFMMGLGTAAITGFMMKVISKQFTGTQFALLTSLTAVTRVILTAHAGHIVEKVGWDLFFLGTVPLAIPGLLLLRHYDQWETSANGVHQRIGNFDLTLVFVFMGSLFALSSDPFFRWIGQKEMGDTVVLAGAVGICVVIAAGLIKPYLPAFRTTASVNVK